MMLLVDLWEAQRSYLCGELNVCFQSQNTKAIVRVRGDGFNINILVCLYNLHWLMLSRSLRIRILITYTGLPTFTFTVSANILNSLLKTNYTF